MAGHSGWTVTGQVSDQTINTPAGQTVVGTQIYFITGDGNRSSVFITDDHYNEANAHAAIAAKAALVDGVGKLSQGTTR